MVSGILCSTVTPFGDSDAIDMAAYARHLKHLHLAGCKGVVVNSVTGEGATLTAAERAECVAAARDVARNDWCVLACVGTGDPSDLLSDAAAAEASGADGLFVAAPPVDDVFQLTAVMSEVRQASSLPTILYNKQSSAPWTPAHLAIIVREVPGVVGIAEGNFAQLAQTVRQVGAQAKVYCTRDSYIEAAAAAGAAGAVSFVANVDSASVVGLWRAIESGEPDAASFLQGRIAELVNALLAQNLTASLKAAMNQLQMRGGRVRPPLSELAASDVAQLVSLLGDRQKVHS
ncbi:MAG: dihydrodipicolinate synthase family protein [Pseudomonadota bacterium]